MEEVKKTHMSTKLQLCLGQMVRSYQRLEEAKNDCKLELQGAYAAYARKPVFGDELIPEKILCKIAEAMAKDTLNDKAREAAVFITSIKQTTGQVFLPGIRMEAGVEDEAA